MPKIKIVKKEIMPLDGKSQPLNEEQRNIWSDYAEANPSLSFDQKFEGFSKKYPNSGIDKTVLRGALDKLRYFVTKAENERIERSEPSVIQRGVFGNKQDLNTGDSFLMFYDEKGKPLGRSDEYGHLEGGKGAAPAILTPKNELPTDIDPSSIYFEGKDYVGYENPHSGSIEFTKFSDMASHPSYYRLANQLRDKRVKEILAAKADKDKEYKAQLAKSTETQTLPQKANILRK